MPLYWYLCEGCGQRRELYCKPTKIYRTTRCLKCGRRMRRSLGFHVKPNNNWPMLSDAAGVHPDQIPDAQREAKDLGVPISFHPDGRAVFTSARHRKEYCEAIGLYDRNAGYGDPVPTAKSRPTVKSIDKSEVI